LTAEDPRRQIHQLHEHGPAELTCIEMALPDQLLDAIRTLTHFAV
jgi:hypothetical protein